MNPVFFSYATVTADAATLYADPGSVSDPVRRELPKDVIVKPYEQIYADLEAAGKTNGKWLVGPTVNVALVERVGRVNVIEASPSPLQMAKALKNKVEIEGFRQSHIRDGIALVTFLYHDSLHSHIPLTV